MYDTSDLRKGLKIVIDGDPYVVVDVEFVKPGKGHAMYKTRLKNLITGYVLDKTYRSGEKLEPADVEEIEMQYLYKDGTTYYFMDNQTYDQIPVEEEVVGEAKRFLVENMNVEVLLFKGRPVGINLPNFVELRVVKADPWLKGDTVAGATKPVTLETGHQIQVPLFVKEGDIIKIDTRTGEYVERVKT
ncbi:elongation factor P [Thermosulfuriphilus ammonigenes]|uniref:Elongation factor P n=1 Tax=Thermosulfuriphilus ammonigenes TaxID=1936021 RepID=A0A6G7PX72_9BACT|nr:elongation factor P [Thermosulfuriphilus ammonigenes]MBA2849608.1 elongation factor P [Thermosulfuriphilus ammonigenes]QIJ72289.1 elongation factor P [Thermosulfuriphilus ammonigenes]